MPFTPIIGTGFEMGNTPPYITWGGNYNAPTVNGGGIGGSYYFNLNGNFGKQPYAYLTIPVADRSAEGYQAEWRYATGSETFSHYLQFSLGSGQVIELRSTANITGWHYMDAYINGSKVASGTVPLSGNNWNHIQMHLIVADSGLFQSKINGYLDISYSGDTQPGGATTITSCNNYSNMGGGSINLGIDNWVYGINDWPEDFRFEGLMPSADTATAQLTCSSGSTHYSLLSERPPNDSTYVTGDTNGLRDVYELADWNSTNKILRFIIQHIRASKTGAGSQGVKMIAINGGSENLGSGLILSTSVAPFYRNLLVAPDGGAWDATKLNDLKLGVEVSF